MAEEMRQILYRGMKALMRENEKIVSIGADLDKPDGLFPLREEFPERVFSAGIAEQNMAGMAAGLASRGLIPFINTFCSFATRRICDQVAVSICYADNNVKIIGTDPGISAELNGGTHMAFEDVGVMRSIPNMTILEPADGIELEQMLPALVAHKGPVYLRMHRKEPDVVHEKDYAYRFGKADVLRQGKDITVFASGIMATSAMAAAAELAGNGIDAEVINIHTIKPLDICGVVDSVKKTGVAVTAENHNILGGLRSAVSEAVTEHFPVPVLPVGVRDRKGEVGKLPYLRERFGLDERTITETVFKAMKMKVALPCGSFIK
jgi:transketolase